MKKAICVLLCVLTALIALIFLSFPFMLAAAFFNFELELIRLPLYTAILAGLSVCIVILTLIFRYEPESTTQKILLSLLLPFSMVNAVFCIDACRQLSVIICSLIFVGCCCYLTIRYGWPRTLKLVVLIECALLIFPFYVIAFSGNDFSQSRLTDRIESPDGAYYVQAEIDEHTYLNGDTVIRLFKNQRFDLFIFDFYEYPNVVSSCDRSEVESLDIHWKDETCLVIGAEEFNIEWKSYLFE